QGNHDIKGTDQDWYDNVSDLIPDDAIQMAGQKDKNYALVRGNVLIVTVSYGQIPFAYDFVREMIETYRDQVDHIIVSSHNTMVGSRYGNIRERAVEAYDTSEGDQQFLLVHDDYRQLFADNDVIYVAGHEHQYIRSLISGYYGGHYTCLLYTS
ncbi:serine/threonine protein phosphatase, partial [Tannerella forsythia]